MLIAYFVMTQISLWGANPTTLQAFEQLSIILGAEFGSIVSLGIGPIVTASIVLQLLTGSGLLKLDTSSTEGRAFFQGLQKLLAIFFIVFESIVFVMLGGIAPAAGFSPAILIFQLILGGFLIMMMDEVVSKWGFGSGISLFIVAGVSKSIMIQAFSPLVNVAASSGSIQALPVSQRFFWNSQLQPVGQVFQFFIALFAVNIQNAILPLSAILMTGAVFLMAVYAQSMKVEIPLTFGRVRGHGMRWPLSFLYTSNIPVILIAALLANLQIASQLLLSKFPTSGILAFVGQLGSPPNVVGEIIISLFGSSPFPWKTILPVTIVYFILMILGSIVFAVFWVQTSGMDAGSQAKQILNSGLQIPGFRRDERILERVLKRYIFPLTVMGGAAVGLIAALADISGSLSRGTGILLAVMIIYKLYEDIAKQHMMDMHPAMQKFMGGGE